jgi:hypothetical protein
MPMRTRVWLAALLLLPATAAAPSPDPFGEGYQFYWVCEAKIERGPSKLRGDWIVDSSSSRPGTVQWEYSEPIIIDDYQQQSRITQTASWSLLEHKNAFELGGLTLWWQASRKLPKQMIVSFGGSNGRGDFVATMGRGERQTAHASLDLGQLLRWAGAEPALRISVYRLDGGLYYAEYLGGGTMPVATYRQLELDFRALRAELEAKAADFQAQCKRQELSEEERNAIII